MKLSWNSLKISIAGARLTHLAQQDKIWDHGTMVEQVKNVFYKIERARLKDDLGPLQKNVTDRAFATIVKDHMEYEDPKKVFLKNVVLTEVSILEVNVRTNKYPDRFTALVKGKRQVENDQPASKNYGVEKFSRRWQFVRQGDWWLLDTIK